MSPWTRDPLLREFHRARLYTEDELAARERRPSVAKALAEVRKIDRRTRHTAQSEQLTRRQAAACISIALVLTTFGTTSMAYYAGRAAEAELTLDAYGTAEYATELLRQYVPQGERALASCIASDAELQAVLEGGPVWEARVRQLLGSAAEARVE